MRFLQVNQNSIGNLNYFLKIQKVYNQWLSFFLSQSSKHFLQFSYVNSLWIKELCHITLYYLSMSSKNNFQNSIVNLMSSNSIFKHYLEYILSLFLLAYFKVSFIVKFCCCFYHKRKMIIHKIWLFSLSLELF